jgi:hypothetical protein
MNTENEITKLPLDVVLTLVRYAVIAWCFKSGVTESDVMTAYANLAVGGVTVIWGLQASGYWTRLVNWFKSFNKDV